MVIGDLITIRVREAQAIYAEYWLQKLGIPFEGGLSPEVAAKYRNVIPQKHGTFQETGVVKKSLGFTSVIDAINDLADRIAAHLPT